MSLKIQCKDKTFDDIKLILVDICGTMFDFDELWLKQIGYLAQNLAENHATVRGELFRIRAMLIKALGVDPEVGQIDYTGAYLSCSDQEIRAILATVLYLNNVEWLEAVKSVKNTISNMLDEVDFKEYIKLYPDTNDFLRLFSKDTRILPFSLKTFVKSDLILMQYYKLHNIENCCPAGKMNIGAENRDILKYYCSQYDIKPENILILADSLGDFPVNTDVNKVFVNRSLIEKDYLDNISIVDVISNLGELKYLNG